MIIESTSAVCTLFEGNYHYGVAGLINSLYSNGFLGNIFVGYRGTLPQWSNAARSNESDLGTGGRSMTVTEGVAIHFIPLETDYHFTNYKPDFMLDLWKGPARLSTRMFYFDPDIVVTAPWTFFIQWVQYGVALCEDVNSPLPENHPRRAAWRDYYSQRGIRLTFRDASYANGGFIGLTRDDSKFLSLWKTMQELMAPAIGGLRCSALSSESLHADVRSPFSPFGKTDQDALNASLEAWSGKVSFVGKEGMSITSGAPLMPHAIGHPKPWNWNPLLQAFAGRPPRRVDREYWKHAEGVIAAHPRSVVQGRLRLLKLAALIGRFYRRR